MKPNHLYMIIGKHTGHFFKLGELVCSPDGDMFEYVDYYCNYKGWYWCQGKNDCCWVAPEDIIEIGPI